MAERRIIKGWVVERGDDGSLRTIGPANAPAMPADPTFGTKGPKAAADLTGQNLQNKKITVDTEGSALDNQRTAAQIKDTYRGFTQNPISDRDQALINSMRMAQGDLPGVMRDIGAAASAVDRFKPEPGKGSKFSWMVPEDNDWPITAAAKNALGWVAGLTDQESEDYQTITSLQNQSVLNAQLAQKGPQTESDAVRMKLAGISPNKSVRPNAQLLARQAYDTDMKMRKPAFFEFWANRLGSTHALNAEGKSADQVWNESYAKGQQQLYRDPRYTGIFGRGRPKKSGGGSNVLKVERVD